MNDRVWNQKPRDRDSIVADALDTAERVLRRRARHAKREMDRWQGGSSYDVAADEYKEIQAALKKIRNTR